MSLHDEHFIKAVDPAGRYLVVCRPYVWSVCDLLERKVIRSFPYGDSNGLHLKGWQVDIEHDRVFHTTLCDQLICYSLRSGEELWRRYAENAAFSVNYRTGSLLLDTSGLQYLDPKTGKKDRKLQPPVDTSFASAHPSLPVTLYCRFERIPGPGSSWQWEKRYIFEFYHEDTQERVMNACGWKQTPFKALFVGDDCYVQEIGGVLHKLNVHTAERAWVTTLKNRGNNMFGGGFHEGRQCVVLKVGIHDAILFMDPATGETIKHQLAPHSWGAFTSLNCLVDNNTKLLLMDGRMFDVDTLELVEEGVFASMGLIFGPPEK